MGLLRRILVALGLAVLAAAGIRIGGGREVQGQRGGWQPLDLSDVDLDVEGAGAAVDRDTPVSAVGTDTAVSVGDQ